MSLSKIRARDLYFTIDGRVLLSIDGNLIALERVVSASSTLNMPDTDFASLSRDIIADSQSLYDLVRHRAESMGEVYHGDCLYRFSRLSAQMDGALFHLRRLEAEVPDLAQLGLPPNLIWQMEQTCNKAGLVVAVGLDEARRTALESSLLSLLLRTRGGLAWTLESRPSYRLAGLYNNEHHEGYCVQANVTEMSWGESIRAACRSGADYIFVDEVKDSQCVAQALTASASGHFVLLGLYAATIPEALARLADYAAPVLSQALTHKLMAQTLLLTFGGEGDSTLFAGSQDSAVRGKIKAAKWVMLISDIESQMERIQHGQPLFT